MRHRLRRARARPDGGGRSVKAQGRGPRTRRNALPRACGWARPGAFHTGAPGGGAGARSPKCSMWYDGGGDTGGGSHRVGGGVMAAAGHDADALLSRPSLPTLLRIRHGGSGAALAHSGTAISES